MVNQPQRESCPVKTALRRIHDDAIVRDASINRSAVAGHDGPLIRIHTGEPAEQIVLTAHRNNAEPVMVQVGFGFTVTVRVQVLTQPFFVTVTVTVKLDGGHVGHKSANMRAAFNCGNHSIH